MPGGAQRLFVKRRGNQLQASGKPLAVSSGTLHRQAEERNRLRQHAHAGACRQILTVDVNGFWPMVVAVQGVAGAISTS